jgi:hypothetical protein
MTRTEYENKLARAADPKTPDRLKLALLEAAAWSAFCRPRSYCPMRWWEAKEEVWGMALGAWERLPNAKRTQMAWSDIEHIRCACSRPIGEVSRWEVEA